MRTAGPATTTTTNRYEVRRILFDISTLSCAGFSDLVWRIATYATCASVVIVGACFAPGGPTRKSPRYYCQYLPLKKAFDPKYFSVRCFTTRWVHFLGLAVVVLSPHRGRLPLLLGSILLWIFPRQPCTSSITNNRGQRPLVGAPRPRAGGAGGVWSTCAWRGSVCRAMRACRSPSAARG